MLIASHHTLGVGIGALQGFARASPSAPVFITELHDWIVSFFSLTLFTNFTSTCKSIHPIYKPSDGSPPLVALIAARIVWVHRQMVGSVNGREVLPAAIVIIESGAIYSACLIILLSLYVSGSFAQYIVLDAVTQVIVSVIATRSSVISYMCAAPRVSSSPSSLSVSDSG